MNNAGSTGWRSDGQGVGIVVDQQLPVDALQFAQQAFARFGGVRIFALDRAEQVAAIAMPSSTPMPISPLAMKNASACVPAMARSWLAGSCTMTSQSSARNSSP